MHLAIHFIHFLYGQADKNKQKLGAFVLIVIFERPRLNLLYTHTVFWFIHCRMRRQLTRLSLLSGHVWRGAGEKEAGSRDRAMEWFQVIDGWLDVQMDAC